MQKTSTPSARRRYHSVGPRRFNRRYFYQLLSALRTLHACNIIHRDLKSANIFLGQDRKQVKLGDMNVSKILKKDFASTQTGTPYYASPEVWRDEDYNAKADIWSLGCVIFELCNLKQPFQASGLDRLYKKVQGKQIERFDNSYSKKLQEIVHQCLTLDYLKRPTARELMQNKIFKDFKSPRKKRGKENEDRHMQTKVKYSEKLDIVQDQDTVPLAERRTEDKLIVMNKRKRKVKRWGRLISEHDSSIDMNEVILGTIPVDLDFKSLAKKLPKPRYSLSREKKSKSKIFENGRRSKSGVRLVENDNREKLKRLRQRRLRLMGEAKGIGGGLENGKKKKRKRETMGSISIKTKKSVESSSVQSRVSKRQKKKKGSISQKNDSNVIGRSKKGKRRRPILKKDPIEKSLLREKEKQDQILSKIEMCHSQLVKQNNSISNCHSKVKVIEKNKSIQQKYTTQRKSKESLSISQKRKIKQNENHKEIVKKLFEKKEFESYPEKEEINLKYTRDSRKSKKNSLKPLTTQFELNNSYNLLRPIESIKLLTKDKTLKNAENDEPQKKIYKPQVTTNRTSRGVKTSMDRQPRKINVDKITYTFSKKENNSKKIIQCENRKNAINGIQQNYQSNVLKRREISSNQEIFSSQKVSENKNNSQYQGLPQVHGIGSVPEITLDKGKVVVRQRLKENLKAKKFLKLMETHKEKKTKLSHQRRRSDDPLRLMKLKGIYKTQNSSEYLGYQKVDFLKFDNNND